MGNFDVKVRTLDDETLYTHKRLTVGSKRIDTPCKALPSGKTTKKDPLNPSARGFNEHYFEIDEDQLEEAQRLEDANLKKNFGRSLNKGSHDEIDVVFVNYKSVGQLSEENLTYLVDLIYSTSDFVTVPLMPEQLSLVKEDGQGTSSIHFDQYLNNIRNFITVARQLNGKPIMGVIPTMPRVFINKIIDEYLEAGIRAFCFNFNGRTVTAQKQLTDMVAPLMRRVAVQGMEEDVIFYSLNAHRGRSRDGGSYIPARDFLSFGFGMDILGEKHTGADLPPHLIQKLNDGDPQFRLFHKDDYTYVNHNYGRELERNLPDDTGLDVDRILRNSDYNYKFATIINSEQQGLETKSLQPAIDERRVYDHVDKKRGIPDSVLESMQSTRDTFEGSQNQSTLSGLDKKLG